MDHAESDISQHAYIFLKLPSILRIRSRVTGDVSSLRIFGKKLPEDKSNREESRTETE